MMTSTFIYGYYLGDGVAIHTHHYDPDRDGRPGEPGVYPLYSIDDDGEGLSCDECGEYIFEPFEENVTDD